MPLRFSAAKNSHLVAALAAEVKYRPCGHEMPCLQNHVLLRSPGEPVILRPNTPRPPPQRYNIRVLTPNSEQEAAHKHHRHAVYASETTGLLMIAAVLLLLTLVRCWREMHWSLR